MRGSGWRRTLIFMGLLAMAAVPGRAGDTGGSAGTRPLTGKQALVPALMSAVIPGSGQLRNGSLLRGVSFAAIEATGWMAYLSFRHQSEEKRDAAERFADRYWAYDRYHRVAPNADSCAAYGCGCGDWSQQADSLIALAGQQRSSRFFDYITRDDYACGWDSQTSRGLYADLWDDRDDLEADKRLTGRLILLNHLVSAVDAFLQARRVRLAGVADLGVRVADAPYEPHAQLVFSARID